MDASLQAQAERLAGESASQARTAEDLNELGVRQSGSEPNGTARWGVRSYE